LRKQGLPYLVELGLGDENVDEMDNIRNPGRRTLKLSVLYSAPRIPAGMTGFR